MKTTYNIDTAHSTAHFVVRHMMISNVRGLFRKVSGTILYDPENPAQSSVEATIDAASIATNDDQRDTHLRSADFLDVEKFPAITFRSRSVDLADGKLVGDLTIHGVTRQVTLDVDGPTAESKDPFGFVRIGASASTKIKRSEYGLTWNAALETGGILVGDELKIEIDVSAIRQATAANPPNAA